MQDVLRDGERGERLHRQVRVRRRDGDDDLDGDRDGERDHLPEPRMKHDWRCWLRWGWHWRYTCTTRGAWLTRTCRRCGYVEESILAIYRRRMT